MEELLKDLEKISDESEKMIEEMKSFKKLVRNILETKKYIVLEHQKKSLSLLIEKQEKDVINCRVQALPAMTGVPEELISDINVILRNVADTNFILHLNTGLKMTVHDFWEELGEYRVRI